MSEIKIEKGIELPACNRREFYPWHQMKIGDSFFVKKIKPTTMQNVASQFARRQSPKWKFACRSMDGGVRVWRIE